MRLAFALLAVLAFAVPAARAAAPIAETFSIEDARGTVTIRGTGIVIGRFERGEIQVTDLTPSDQWSPRVNGVPRGRYRDREHGDDDEREAHTWMQYRHDAWVHGETSVRKV